MPEPILKPTERQKSLYCSFCGKSQHEVRKLIAGPTVFICDECVKLCMDIVKEEHRLSFPVNGDPEYFSWDLSAPMISPTAKNLAEALISNLRERGYAITPVADK